MSEKAKKKKIGPVAGLTIAVAIGILGMLSVFVAGNARGYDPSLTILLRNTLLLSAFFLVYGLLRKFYKGDFSILILTALLTSIGFVVQYRISSAINVDFQKALVRQYSAAAAQKASLDSLGVDTTAVAGSPAVRDERSLETIQEEARQLLRVDKLQGKQIAEDFVKNLPGWSRLFVSYLAALLVLVYLVRKSANDSFMDAMERPFFWVAVTIFLLMIFVALSEVGARGRFVFNMTPWEAFKITIVIFLAGFFARYKDDFVRTGPRPKGKWLSKLIVPWGPFLLIWLIPQLLFVLLKDFGQVIIYGGLVVIMIFVTTRKYKYLFGGIIATVLISKSIFLLEGIAPPHVLQRFVIWADIWRMPHDASWWDNVYQIMNSFFALHAGGWTGSGLGLGYPTNIPLVVSDFVYSAIAEELGFIGSILVVMLYLVLFLQGMKIALQAERDFEKLLAVGFTSILAIQVFVNIGGVIKLIPLTGITLPLISRGGFSFLISMVLIGLLMGLSHRNGARQFE